MATDTKEQIAESDFAGHEYLTAAETIVFLRLDQDERDPKERLRNLIRYQGLPSIRRGRLLLFKRYAIQKWLER